MIKANHQRCPPINLIPGPAGRHYARHAEMIVGEVRGTRPRQVVAEGRLSTHQRPFAVPASTAQFAPKGPFRLYKEIAPLSRFVATHVGFGWRLVGGDLNAVRVRWRCICWWRYLRR